VGLIYWPDSLGSFTLIIEWLNLYVLVSEAMFANDRMDCAPLGWNLESRDEINRGIICVLI
jgi:hypothetical protein